MLNNLPIPTVTTARVPCLCCSGDDCIICPHTMEAFFSPLQNNTEQMTFHSMSKSTAALVSDSSENENELQNVAELVCALFVLFFSSHSFLYLTRIETPSQHFKIYNFNYHAHFWRGSFGDPIKAYMCLHGRRGATKANETTPVELTKHMKCLNQAILNKSE